MFAQRTNFKSIGSFVNKAAVAAAPAHLFGALEYLVLIDVLQEDEFLQTPGWPCPAAGNLLLVNCTHAGAVRAPKSLLEASSFFGALHLLCDSDTGP